MLCCRKNMITEWYEAASQLYSWACRFCVSSQFALSSVCVRWSGNSYRTWLVYVLYCTRKTAVWILKFIAKVAFYSRVLDASPYNEATAAWQQISIDLTILQILLHMIPDRMHVALFRRQREHIDWESSRDNYCRPNTFHEGVKLLASRHMINCIIILD